MSNLDRDSFHILSLDGGGVRGYLSALILSKMEKRVNDELREDKSIGQRFDLIAGTSTGAVIALALSVEGGSAAKVVEFYEKHMESIFGKQERTWCEKLLWFSHLGNLFRPKFDPKPLHHALTDYFGEQTLEDVTTDVCITSVAMQTGKPRLYKSRYFERNAERLNEKLVDIALASSAAPPFFPAHTPEKHSGLLVDGGLCANNPTLIAIIDALNISSDGKDENRQTLDQLKVLSVGTGELCGLPFDARSMDKAGKLQWVWPKRLFSRAPSVPLVELFMHAQSNLADKQAEFLLRNRGCYERINPELGFPYALDDIGCINDLKNVADTTAVTENVMKNYFGIE